jgi:hypothetical protein
LSRQWTWTLVYRQMETNISNPEKGHLASFDNASAPLVLGDSGAFVRVVKSYHQSSLPAWATESQPSYCEAFPSHPVNWIC